MMLQFVCELDRILKKSPDQNRWSLSQLAEQTQTPLFQVVDIISMTLDREIDLQDSLAMNEINKALNLLKDRLKDEINAIERVKNEKRIKALNAYDFVMEKIRLLQHAKNWHSAYRTIAYYLGTYEKDLPRDVLLTVVGDSLRIGLKATINIQELGHWFKKAIMTDYDDLGSEAFEETLDFMDAYVEDLISFSPDAAKRIVLSTSDFLKPFATKFSRSEQLEKILQLANT